MPAIESVRPSSRWATRIIPPILAVAVGFATYVTVARVCATYLIQSQRRDGPAIAILILYFVLLLLTVAAYARTLYTANYDTGATSLGPSEILRRSRGQTIQKPRDEVQGWANVGPEPRYDPDSPSSELFYTKDVFVCESDGRPRWCSECCNWKPDRAHHSSELNRCVLRMDHYCPWAGGMIAETSFKFFIQFVMYACLYWTVVLAATVYTLRQQINDGSPVDGFLVGAIALAAFFGLFSFLMTVTSARYVFLNMTNVDMLAHQSKVYQLAVRVPRGSKPTDKYMVVTYPLPKPGQPMNGPTNGSAVPNGSTIPSNHNGEQIADPHPTPRDDLATRSFAIVRTESGENPWDLGMWRNWKSTMGSNPIDWLLPVRKSPFTNHDSHVSFYPMGHDLSKVCARYGLKDLSANESDGLEMNRL